MHEKSRGSNLVLLAICLKTENQSNRALMGRCGTVLIRTDL
jgi:hypothetical protein